MPGAAPSTVWDRWSQWLLRGREGGDQALRQRFLAEILLPVRDQVLDRGRIEKGEVVLDVGAGDGLIAFGALDRVGSTGRVIFSDVSPDLLQKCRSLATELNLSDRCSFVECPADNLTGTLDAMIGFDERDLFTLAEEVGFVELHLELRRRAARRPTPRSWDSFCSSSPNPLSPTFGEVIESALSAEEAGRFTAHLRP